MNLAFAGFVFLIADLFPIGWEFATIIMDPIHQTSHDEPIAYAIQRSITVLLSFLPATVAAAFFFRKTQLRERITQQQIETKWLSIGATLMIISTLLQVAGAFIPHDGLPFVVALSHLMEIIVWPAKAILFFGATSLLMYTNFKIKTHPD